jgi:PAS domain S-box-containing protein
MDDKTMRRREPRQPLRPAWLAAATGTFGREHGRIVRSFARISPAEQKRLRAHVVALAAVAAAAAARWIVGLPEIPFMFYSAAIAISASFGVPSAAAVATLASLLVTRMGAGVSFWVGAGFCVEAFVISAVVFRLVRVIENHRQRLAAADKRVGELKAVEREGQVVGAAFSCLEAAASDKAVAILDTEGRIVDWRAGAVRLYGNNGGVLGTSAATVFFPELNADSFRRLLGEARRVPGGYRGRQHRADGTVFDGEVEISPLSRGGADGFAVVVHDLTRQHAWEAFATSSAETHAVLRQEADTAHRQLATLQDVTDPSLNALTGGDLVTTLLDRLRAAIGAEGIAFADVGRFRPRVFCAPGGVQCAGGVNRHRAESRSQQSARTLLIHNDGLRVAEMSVVEWPEGVSSLIAVPVVRAGITQAVIEVVNMRGRRSTEWEIALVQVVAARIAGLVRDDAYADAGAVA